MPARKKTRRELELSGGLKKNPSRYAGRAASTSSKPLGYAPKHLNPEQRSIWKQIAALAPEGVLTEADTFSVELAARLIHRSRQPGFKASEVAVLSGLLGKLGLTPVDRQRLDIQPAPVVDPNDPWADFERAFAQTGGTNE